MYLNHVDLCNCPLSSLSCHRDGFKSVTIYRERQAEAIFEWKPEWNPSEKNASEKKIPELGFGTGKVVDPVLSAGWAG